MKQIVLMSLMSILLVASVFAVSPNSNGQAGKSKMNHLYLFEKSPSDWSIVEGGAWGKMTFDDNSFVFNGHGLEAAKDYTLVYYKDPWNGGTTTVNQCLDSGIANDAGDLNLAGSYDFTSIPETGDLNYPNSKIWLVQSSDISCPTSGMIAWNPTEYLFESELI